MSMKCQSIMAKRVPDDAKIREWNDFIDQMANYHPPNPNYPILPPRQESIPTAAFAIEGGRLYEHPDGYIRMARQGDWLVVLLPRQPGMLSLTNDPPSIKFRLVDIPQGQWVQLRSHDGYSSVALPPGTNPALPVGIYQSNNRLLGQWIR